jgi:hypothetical protein
MSHWRERPREEANLLNPPYLSLLLMLATEHYQKTSKSPMPFVYAHIILSVVLHKATREALPRTALKGLSTWIEENPTLRALLPDNVRALRPFVREAMLHGLAHGSIVVESGALSLGQKPRGIPAYETGSTSEVADCIKKARFTGRWFASAGSPPTVMALWGIHP